MQPLAAEQTTPPRTARGGADREERENAIKRGLCDSAATPVILSESPATAWVDGCNGMGPVVGNFCMQLAMRKAQETGVSAVAVKGSNHFGICAHYANQALKDGLIPFLGTNPLCLAAPSLCGDSFVLDMATSSITLGTRAMNCTANGPVALGLAGGPDEHRGQAAAVGLGVRPARARDERPGGGAAGGQPAAAWRGGEVGGLQGHRARLHGGGPLRHSRGCAHRHATPRHATPRPSPATSRGATTRHATPRPAPL
ncbi:Putative malate dehydrogenase [Gryllus bimaculatus]|nr:Putative malate dehydrogenase [Gryllus bimaculatus]